MGQCNADESSESSALTFIAGGALQHRVVAQSSNEAQGHRRRVQRLVAHSPLQLQGTVHGVGVGVGESQ